MPVSPSTPIVPTGMTVPAVASQWDWAMMMSPVASPRLSRMCTALTVMEFVPPLEDVICSFRMTVARPATVSVVFGPGLTARVAPDSFAFVNVDDPETPDELAVQLLAMRSAVSTPASALTVATDAELAELGDPVVEPWVAALRIPADRTLQAVPAQMLTTDWLRLPPVGGRVTVGVGPAVTWIPATVALTLTPNAEPLTVPSAHAGVAAARASPARATRLTPRSRMIPMS